MTASAPPPLRSSASSPAGETVYGVNTGFGLLASTRIPDDRLAELQRNLILSHSCGLGEPLPRHVTRLMIVLKLLGLGRGHSGVRPLVIDALQALLDRDAMPVIPSQGSVGASGDLAPLAHLIAALIGHGQSTCRRSHSRRRRPAALGMEPLQLGPKEGLALINGTQASDRDRARRFVHGRAGVRRRDRRRRAVGRRLEGQRHAVRPAPLSGCAASPARSASPPQSPPCSTAAKSSPATSAAAGSRTRTASAASRR